MSESQHSCFQLVALALGVWLLASMIALIGALVWAGWSARKHKLLIRSRDRLFVALPGLVGCGVILAHFIPRKAISLPFEATCLVLLLASAVCVAWALFFCRPESKAIRWVHGTLLSFLAALASFAAHQTALAYTLSGLNQADPSQRAGTLTEVGQLAPDVSLTLLDGTPTRLGDLRGRVVLLNFFATWCGPCRLELPHLQAFWDEHRANPDLRVLVVGREETAAVVAQFKAENSFTFPMAPDPDRAVYESFATQYIPRTYLISRDGKIVYQSTGFYEEELGRLKAVLADELARKP